MTDDQRRRSGLFSNGYIGRTIGMSTSSGNAICRLPYVLIRAGWAIVKAVSSSGTNCFLGCESESGVVKEKTASSTTPRITDLMTTGYARSCASSRGFEHNRDISIVRAPRTGVEFARVQEQS